VGPFFVVFAVPVPFAALLPVAPAAAVAADPAAGDAGGGEGLPGAGICPPFGPLPWALFAAGLRVGLDPALLSSAAKSGPPPLRAAESDVVPLVDAGSMWAGACENVGITFIPAELASDVPSAACRRHFRDSPRGFD
jgi:hypothetical protein